MGSDDLFKYWLADLIFDKRNKRLFFAQFFVPFLFSLSAVYVFTQTSWSKYNGRTSPEFISTDIVRNSSLKVPPVQVFFHSCNLFYDVWKYKGYFDVQCLEPHYMPDLSSYRPGQTFVVIDSFSNYTYELSFRIVDLSLKLQRTLHPPWGILSTRIQSNDQNDLISFIQEGIVAGLSRNLSGSSMETRKNIIVMPVFKYSLLKAFKFLSSIAIAVCSPGIWLCISHYENEFKSKGKNLLISLKVINSYTYVASNFLISALKFFLGQLLFWLPIFAYNSKFMRVSNFIISSLLLSLNISAYCYFVCSTFRSRNVSAIVLFGTLFFTSLSFSQWHDFLPDSILSYATTIFFPVAYQFYMRITANIMMSDKFQDVSSVFSAFLIGMLLLDCGLMLLWAMFREEVFPVKRKAPAVRLKLSTSVSLDTKSCLMELSDVKVKKRRESVLSDINLTIYKNEITALYGKGSQELLQTIRGDLVNTGSIFIFDGELMNEDKIISSTEDLHMISSLTVVEHIELLIGIRQASNIDFHEMLDDLGLTPICHFFYHELKEEHKHLLKIMYAFLSNASIILLNEPFDCDVSVHHRLSNFMRKQKNGRAIVFTCDDLDVLNEQIDSIVLLVDGEVWRKLSSAEFRKETQVLILWSRSNLNAATISAIKKKVCACLGSKFKGRLVSYRQPKGALTFRAPSISIIKYSKLLRYLKNDESFEIDNCELKMSTPVDDYIRCHNTNKTSSVYNFHFIERISPFFSSLPDIPTLLDQKLTYFSKNNFASLSTFALPILLAILVSIFNSRRPLNEGFVNVKRYMNENENTFFSIKDKQKSSSPTNPSNCSHLTGNLLYNFGVVRSDNVTYLCSYESSLLSTIFLNQMWQNDNYGGFKLNVTVETIYSRNWRFLIDYFLNLKTLAGIPIPVLSVSISDNWLEVLMIGLEFLLCITHVTLFFQQKVDSIKRKKNMKPFRFWVALSIIDFVVSILLMIICTFIIVFPHLGLFVSLLTITSSAIAYIGSMPFLYIFSMKTGDSLSVCFSSFLLLGGLILPGIYSLFSSPFSSEFESSISLMFSLSTIFPPVAPALVTAVSAYYKLQNRNKLFVIDRVSLLYLIAFMPVWTWIFMMIMYKRIFPKFGYIVKSLRSKSQSHRQNSRLKSSV